MKHTFLSHKKFRTFLLLVTLLTIKKTHVLSLILTFPYPGLPLVFLKVFRGNQRDRDRERAQARNGHKSKQTKDDGLTPEQRRERDAKALQEKAARKAAQASSGGGNDNRGRKAVKK
ncbi:hypothetical protein PVL29_009240 [Vitis rotundifolia]|uniref:Small EDRK-rich factor-like N-terminal domain-containing protein n=1 Tax=Vitis rotundifolia TaxID=103349 RepID=A0AA39DUE7_VITRO|nr:hypothetical protein PVL29_009240 [Vitis rotundifolia]